MLATFNEKHYAALFAAARDKGAEVGKYVREQGWVAADASIARAATGYVNRLPLNNVGLEKELRAAFIAAAITAAEVQS